jgi:hypothetical protein
LDRLIDLLGPGLILLGIALWLVRKALKAAATERDLEEERLRKALADHLVEVQVRPPGSVPFPPLPGRGSDPGARASARVSDPGAGPGPRAPGLIAIEPLPAVLGLPRPVPQPPEGDLLWLPGVVEGARAAQGPRSPRDGQAFNALAGADIGSANPEHLALVAALLTERQAVPGAGRLEVLWVRSAGAHVAWCERRHPVAGTRLEPHPSLLREVISVAQVDGGKIVSRSNFG